MSRQKEHSARNQTSRAGLQAGRQAVILGPGARRCALPRQLVRRLFPCCPPLHPAPQPRLFPALPPLRHWISHRGPPWRPCRAHQQLAALALACRRRRCHTAARPRARRRLPPPVAALPDAWAPQSPAAA